MQKDNYLTAAYEVAKQDLPVDGFDFDKLWKMVAKRLKMNQETFKTELLGDFYTDLLQDGNFVFLGDNMWVLRENITYDRYQRLRDSISDKDLNLSDAEYGGYSPEEVDNIDTEYDDKEDNNGRVADDELVEDDYDTDLDDEKEDDDEEDSESLDSDFDDEDEEDDK